MIKSKKSVHINLKYDTHKGFKIECFKRNLSMQEVFEEFASKVANEQNDVIKILENLSKAKQIKSVRNYTKSETDSIFNLLEEDNPLKGD